MLPAATPMPERDSKTFELTSEAAGLLITALIVWLVASALQLAFCLFSWGNLRPGVGPMVYLFAFYVLSLFLTVGTRQRPDYAPFLLQNLALHGGFLLVGVW